MKLDLGRDKNYKSKNIQNRWEKQRESWLQSHNKEKSDPRDGFPSRLIPPSNKFGPVGHDSTVRTTRKNIKKTMKKQMGPYKPF